MGDAPSHQNQAFSLAGTEFYIPCLLLFSEVPHDSDNLLVFLRIKEAEVDLDREGGAILTADGLLEHDGDTGLHVFPDPGVPVSRVSQDEIPDMKALALIQIESGHAADSLIAEQEPSTQIVNENGLHRIFHHAAEPGFALLQRRLCLVAVRDVLAHDQQQVLVPDIQELGGDQNLAL